MLDGWLQVVTLMNDLDDEITSGTYIDSNGEGQGAAVLTRGLESAAKAASATSTAIATGDLASVGPAVSYQATAQAKSGKSAAAPSHPSAALTPPFVSASSAPRRGSASGGSNSAAQPPSPLILPRRLQSQPLALPHRAAVRAVLSSPCNPIPEHGQDAASPPPAPVASTGGDQMPLLATSSGGGIASTGVALVRKSSGRAGPKSSTSTA